jgi:hypothetical protein
MRTRVWSKEINGYLNPSMYFLDSKGRVYYYNSHDLQRLDKDSYIVQRSVGLDDIYGIEIFEGDLVKLFFHHENLNTETYELKYIRGQWCLDNENSSPFLFKRGGPRVIVVGSALEKEFR